MAELHIEKKRRSSGLWIVIGLIVAALLAWILLRPDTNRSRGDIAPATTGVLPTVDARPLAALEPFAANSGHGMSVAAQSA